MDVEQSNIINDVPSFVQFIIDKIRSPKQYQHSGGYSDYCVFSGKKLAWHLIAHNEIRRSEHFRPDSSFELFDPVNPKDNIALFIPTSDFASWEPERINQYIENWLTHHVMKHFSLDEQSSCETNTLNVIPHNRVSVACEALTVEEIAKMCVYQETFHAQGADDVFFTFNMKDGVTQCPELYWSRENAERAARIYITTGNVVPERKLMN